MNHDRSKKSRVVIIDDHQIIIEGITSCLRDTPDLEVCGSSGTLTGGLETIRTCSPDAVILDLSLEGGHGLDLLPMLKDEHPALPVLVLSMHEESVYAERAIRAGARGYIMKNQSFQRVIEALRTLLNGELFFSPEVKEKLLYSISNMSTSVESIDRQLSDRELEAFRLVGKGYRPKVIAEKMNVSIKTIDTYFRRMREKLQVASMSELIELANTWNSSQHG